MIPTSYFFKDLYRQHWMEVTPEPVPDDKCAAEDHRRPDVPPTLIAAVLGWLSTAIADLAAGRGRLHAKRW